MTDVFVNEYINSNLINIIYLNCLIYHNVDVQNVFMLNSTVKKNLIITTNY